MIRTFILCGVAASAFSVAQAAETDLENRLKDCMSVQESDARLACFEELAAPLMPDPAVQKEVEEKRTVRLFGFARREQPVTRVQDFGSTQSQAEEITSISAAITGMNLRFDKASSIELDNGQIWRQVDADKTKLRKLKAGRTYQATVRKAMTSGYWMDIEPMGKTIRVRRVK